jgi:glycosyltransferase involved in cell wall biosynthesis
MAAGLDFAEFRQGFPPRRAFGAVRSMRVLLVAPYEPPGGGMGRMMAYFASAEAATGVCLETVESRGGGSALRSIWYLINAAARIFSAAVGRRPTLVHLNMAEGGSVLRKGSLLLLAHACGLPTVLHLHAANIVMFHTMLPRAGKALMAVVFRRADMCVVLGEPWRHWLATVVLVDPARIAIVRNGVPPPALACRPARSLEFTFLFLGNLLARKGLVDLLHALALLQSGIAQSGLAWRLTVAGGGDSLALQALANGLGLADHVRFAGWVTRDASSLLFGTADALVLPSYQEALPLVLLEAASFGVPIITTPVGAIPELFSDGLDALFVPPGDRPALANALARLMADPELAARLGKNGRLLYDREFTMGQFANRLGAIYAHLCDLAA